MNRYWVSWYQPTSDFRPVKWPLPENFIGYWCSGQRDADSAWTLCAMLDAEDDSVCEQLIEDHWPESKDEDWRFMEIVGSNDLPGDRFPIPEWSPLYRG